MKILWASSIHKKSANGMTFLCVGGELAEFGLSEVVGLARIVAELPEAEGYHAKVKTNGSTIALNIPKSLATHIAEFAKTQSGIQINPSIRVDVSKQELNKLRKHLLALSR